MKRLLLLRHAQAEAGEAGGDRDRKLAPLGRSELDRIARRLQLPDLRPDLALVSPARRTRETWDVVKGPRSEAAVSFAEQIYNASAEQLLDLVREVDGVVADGPAERTLLVGHNPGISELAYNLAGTGEGLERLLRGLPTAGVAVIEFDVEAWREIEPGQGRLAELFTPATVR
jgi:phosphohistidine phosphatase